MPSEFVGRRAELSQLDEFLKRSTPSLAVIYGRRRIGKTELIRNATNDFHAYFFEGLENQPKRQQIANFLFQLEAQIPATQSPTGMKTWREVFYELFKRLTDRHVESNSSVCIVLDEFQWMANYRAEIVSNLKMVWDQFISRIPGAKLILCGSIASFMLNKVLKSSALYGRSDCVIHLKAFHLDESRQMLNDLGAAEVLEAQMLVGGVPKYLELLMGKPSVRLAMEDLAFQDNGYLRREFDRIFTSHFGKNPDYRKIVTVLAAHPYGMFRGHLAKKAKVQLGGGLKEHLSDLEAAGFTTSFTPLDKPENSRLIKYQLTDAYLSFYFQFIQPNLRKIRAGLSQSLFADLVQASGYQSYLGTAFERVCIGHAHKLASILGFSGIDFNCGPFFRSPASGLGGFQIDLLFFRTDHVITLCEMKCSNRPISIKVVKEVERRAAVLHELFPGRTIQRVLILAGEPSGDLIRSGYFYRIIQARELF